LFFVDALIGIRELFSHYPSILSRHTDDILQKILLLMIDPEKVVRMTLLQLLVFIFQSVSKVNNA